MYSRALLLTSTVASDARARGATHATERSLPHAARRDAPPTRHSSRASASDADEKPRPRTVSGAPPSASARAGATQLTAADGWYVNDAAADDDGDGDDDDDDDGDGDGAYCCAFIDTPSAFAPTECTGDAHSSCASSTYRASTARDAFSSRQRSVYASRKPPPTTATRVPPRDGPSGGAAPRTPTRRW